MRIAFAPLQRIFRQVLFNFGKGFAFKRAKATLAQTTVADGFKALLNSHRSGCLVRSL